MSDIQEAIRSVLISFTEFKTMLEEDNENEK